jgi:DeoR/GlpR family transcriptional regulator of sugar metabolism
MRSAGFADHRASPMEKRSFVILIHAWYFFFMHDLLQMTRRDVIAERLRLGNTVVSTALAEEFGISEDAVRRDLRALAAEGRCKRVYGGALPLSPASGTIADRIPLRPDEKLELARTAVRTVRLSGLVFLDGGSTNLALVSMLPAENALIVATNSIAIADAVMRKNGLNLILIGGAVDTSLGSCIDADALQALAKLNIDHCFLGACAVSRQLGLGVFHPGEAHFKRILLARSHQTTVMATQDKLETRAPHVVAPLKAINRLIVPSSTSREVRRSLGKTGAQILVGDRPAK